MESRSTVWQRPTRHRHNERGRQMASLKCIHCHDPKALSEMSKDSSDRRGHKGLCKICAAKKQSDFRATWSTEKHDAVKAAMLVSARKSLYGEEGTKHFEEQRRLQENKCDKIGR